MNNQISLDNETLTKEHEFQLVYSGPTFEQGIKIEKFIENLKSIKELIYNISDVNFESKTGHNARKDIKEIKIIPSKGSIIEKVIILFSNPEIRDLTISTIIGLFLYLLAKHDAKKSEEKVNNKLNQIEDLILRNQLKNVQKLSEPLEQNKDSLKIVENNIVKFEVNFLQKDTINKSIKEIEKEIKISEAEEEFEGYISAVDIDTKRLKFHPKGLAEACPLEFNLPLTTITPLLGKPILAKMRVRRYKDKIRRFELLSHKLIQRDINDFIK